MRALHLPLSMRSRQPRERLHPVRLPRLAPRPRLLDILSFGQGVGGQVGVGVSRSQGDQREGLDFDTLRKFLSLWVDSK